jgi:hypothetical protein
MAPLAAAAAETNPHAKKMKLNPSRAPISSTAAEKLTRQRGTRPLETPTVFLQFISTHSSPPDTSQRAPAIMVSNDDVLKYGMPPADHKFLLLGRAARAICFNYKNALPLD